MELSLLGPAEASTPRAQIKEAVREQGGKKKLKEIKVFAIGSIRRGGKNFKRNYLEANLDYNIVQDHHERRQGI